MDLSKAFDSIPHYRLLAILQACEVSKHSYNLLASYPSNRHQRVKLWDHVSTWMKTIKGVPQGSSDFQLFLLMTYFTFSRNTKMYKYDPPY